MHSNVTDDFALRKGTRPHERHLAAEYVPKLRQFVDRVAAAEGSEAACHTAIVGNFMVSLWLCNDALDPTSFVIQNGIGSPHGSQFQHPKDLLVLSNSPVGN